MTPSFKILSSLICVSQLALISGAQADVYSSRRGEDQFIRTALSGDQVSFSLCSLNQPTRCLPIGERESYSLESLRKARTHLRNCAIGVGVADTAAIALSAGVALVGSTAVVGIGSLMGAVSASGATGAGTGFIVGATGLGAAGGAGLVLSAVSPSKAIRLMKTLDESVITDRSYTTGISVSVFADRLKETLKDHVK